MVSIGRALLNDPHWIRKARVGEPLPGFNPKSLEMLT